MSKLKLVLLAGLVISLAACNSQAPAAPTPTAAQAAPTAAQAAPTPAQAAPTVASNQPSGGISLTPVGVSRPPTLDPAGMCKAAPPPKSIPDFPASLPTDQVKGVSGAKAVLYEYSDFQ